MSGSTALKGNYFYNSIIQLHNYITTQQLNHRLLRTFSELLKFTSSDYSQLECYQINKLLSVDKVNTSKLKNQLRM